jgi:hypothetical protein
LPNDIHNIKNMYLKLTMGKAIKVGSEQVAEETETKKKPAKKAKAKAAPAEEAE